MTREEKRLFMFRVRTDAGLSLAEFGELVGFSAAHVSHLEHDRRTWSECKLKGIEERAAAEGEKKAARVAMEEKLREARRKEKRAGLMMLRLNIGLNQSQFSDMLGVVSATVNANEKGHHEWEEVMFTEAAGAAVRYLAARYQRDLRAVEAWRAIYHPEPAK